MKKVLFGCAAICLLFGACKPKDGGKSRSENLTSGKWMVTAQKSITSLSGVAQPENDDYADLDLCERDDLSIFRSDNHLISDEGTTKCNSTDPQQRDEGTWTLTESDTKLVFTNGTDAFTSTIEQLDDNTMKLHSTYDETIFGIPYHSEINTTFTHVQ